MTKRPWRVKGDDKRTTKLATRPGEIVSVDQLESNTPGLISQLKGKLTQQRYKYATVFVDQFSGYTFVYLQKRLTSEEMVMAKHAFECSADQWGVKIIYYHTDNGRFADNAFIADCKAKRQGLSYCGVNAHFQNGIAERRIRDLQDQTRTSMLYVMSTWKRMVLICLYGPTPCVTPTMLPTRHQEKVRTNHHWNVFRESTSLPNYVISMPSAVLPTYWTTLYKAAKDHRSGNNAQDWAYTSGPRRVMQGPSR